jgi:para-nitrobenzyl esterase
MTRRTRTLDYAGWMVMVGALGTACSGTNAVAPPQATSSSAGTTSSAASGTSGSSAGAGGSSEPSSPTRVTIADGALEGATDGNTVKFLGIPFAKPPIGDLRWKAPQKNDTWSGVRDASNFGKRCAQVESTTLMNAASEDEDCLYLNVWTPNASAKTPLPVMLWIHGGGNVNGSASEPVPYANAGTFYSGRSLAEKGVVVVTFNYRLGVFGFLAHPELSAEKGGSPGNQGLLDQTAAMQWVKANVAKFGGDPKNVTIFGESAGSFDVCLHMASPKSRDLFHRAISESGGCTTKNTTLEIGQQSAQALATSLGCTGSATLACLRGKSVADLLKPVPAVNGMAAPSFGPVVDGQFLPEQARTLYDRGDIAKVPYLLGSNTDEGTLFVSPTLTLDTEQQLMDLLTQQYGAAAAQIAAAYPVSKFAGAPHPIRAAYARIAGDARLVCSTYDSAVRAATAKLPVWMYNFDIPVSVGTDLGATHGSELVYVFNTSPAFTPENMATSDIMESYWTSFAKKGDPNADKQLMWPVFSATSNVRMNFTAMPSVVMNFRAEECAFWRASYDRAFMQ